jgi:hypothetical protein
MFITQAIAYFFGVWENQCPHFPLTPTYSPLLSATSAPIMTLAFHYFPPYYDVSALPAGRDRKVAGRALALAESGDINLPTPIFSKRADEKKFYKFVNSPADTNTSFMEKEFQTTR